MAPTEPASFLPDLEAFLRTRLADAPAGSYSHTLLTDPVAVQRKVMEEAFEVCLELGAADVDRALLAEEAADLVFHLLCGIVGAGGSWAEVESVLRARHQGDGS
jgi:phosphoribosyl-ATP pyrophosphohydrolase